MTDRLTTQDLDKIRKWLGSDLEQLTEESFAVALKATRKKFHPDNFAHLEDDSVMEMAKDRFQELETLADKVKKHLARNGSSPEGGESDSDTGHRYASDGMAIEIMTSDKTLKFQLFNSTMIYEGDKIGIKGTRAKLISRDDYLPRISTGFRDNIKLFLAFGPEDPLQVVVEWLFRHINGRTSNFVIEGKVVPVEPLAILRAIQKEARLELGA